MRKMCKFLFVTSLVAVAMAASAQAPVGIYGGVPSQFRHDGSGYQVAEADVTGQSTGVGTVVPVDLNFNFYALYSWIYADATKTSTGNFLPADTYTISFRGPTGALIGSIQGVYSPTYAPAGGPNGGALQASPLNGQAYTRPGIQGLVTAASSGACARSLVQIRFFDAYQTLNYIIYPVTGDGYYYANDYLGGAGVSGYPSDTQLGGGQGYYLAAYTPADGFGSTQTTNQFINSSGADQLTVNLDVPGCTAQVGRKINRPQAVSK